MRCKYCNIEIGCQSKVCPLCHEKLHLPAELDMPHAYPQKPAGKQPKKRKLFSARSLYLSIALTIFILCIPINLLTTPDLYWFAIVGAVGAYGFVLLHHTILSNNSIGIKIVWQGISILVVLLAVNFLLKKQAPELASTWVWDYGLPSILIIASLVTGIYTSIAFKFWNNIIIDALGISALGFIPLILYAVKVVHHPALSVVSACISSVVIIFCGILGRRTLISEFKKKFHF